MIASQVEDLRGRIRAALRRVEDPDREVRIVAVTKRRPAAAVDEVAAAGLLEIGENRVFEALEKAPLVRAPVRWHLIGHLQRNKVARAVTLFSTIHSVDSERLLEAIAATGASPDLYLEINISGERSKHGARPEEALGLWRAALREKGPRVVGLMTMAPYSEDPEEARPVFSALRRLRDDLDAAGEGPPLTRLSMGMSGDFEVAVEEGATDVRIGTAIFGTIAPRSR